MASCVWESKAIYTKQHVIQTIVAILQAHTHIECGDWSIWLAGEMVFIAWRYFVSFTRESENTHTNNAETNNK